MSVFLFLPSRWCSVSYIANEYSIYHFCIAIKDLSISFSRELIVRDFKTVTFNLLFVYKPTFSVSCFLLNEKVPRFKSVR